MEPRLQSSLLIGLLKRRAESEGGFAAILARGDAEAGAILVVLAERGRKRSLLERTLQRDGRYSWQDIAGQSLEDEAQFQSLLDRRRRTDPDLWIIELDIASAERFVAEMNDPI